MRGNHFNGYNLEACSDRARRALATDCEVYGMSIYTCGVHYAKRGFILERSSPRPEDFLLWFRAKCVHVLLLLLYLSRNKRKH